MNPIVIRSLRWAVVGLAGLALMTCFALACTFVYLAPSLPTAENMHRVEMAVPLRVYTRSGALISQIGEERRIPVRFEEIPLIVRQAVLAAEDDRFFEHEGVDWMGFGRAVFKVAVTGSAVQGGSTITQQAARQLYLTLDKTLRRKLAELFLTWRMEQDFTKEQILSLYLNKIYFGQRSYGIAAAAETYCGKKLSDLTVAEAAMLAGIIQLPSRQNPVSSPKNAATRRSYVLRRMTELGFVDSATAAAAAAAPVDSRGYAPLIDVEGHHVAEMARQKVEELFGKAAVNAGYKVFTTLDDRRQVAANRALRLGLMEYDRRQGYRGPLGKVELPSAADDAELDRKLAEFRAVSLLEPAVVLQVEATTATVHVRGQGKARIAWEGIKWASRTTGKGVGPAPGKASDVLKRGEVIHVIADGRGNAQLAQVPQAQAALVALDPLDGAVVSLVGGFDFYSNQFNRVTQAWRQPMSGFKPFLYSAALENGMTAATRILDAPVLVDDSQTEERWRPGNSDGKWLGDISLRKALLLSRNTVSIRILQNIGIDAFIQHAARFGFDPHDMPRNPTLALGTQSVTPLRLAAGYAVFANGGFRVEPYFIDRIEDATGNVVFQAEPALACAACETEARAPEKALDEHAAMMLRTEASGGAVAGPELVPAVANGAPGDPSTGLPQQDTAKAVEPFGMSDIPPMLRDLASIQGGRGYLPQTRLAPRAISAHNAWLMSDILHDATVDGTARRTRALGRDDLSGKTGTGDDGRDTWFNGFTRDLVATVWVGMDNYQPLGAGAEGANTAVPIWMHYMQEALQGTPPSRLARPPGLLDIPVLPWSGARAGALDSCAVVETFMPGSLPQPSEEGCAGDPAGSGATQRNDLFF